MPTEAISGERIGIALHQLKDLPKIYQHIEERIAVSPQVTALVSTLAELVPGFEESYKRHLRFPRP